MCQSVPRYIFLFMTFCVLLTPLSSKKLAALLRAFPRATKRAQGNSIYMLILPLEGLYLKILQWDTFFKKNSCPIIFAKCSFFVEIRLTPLFQRICGNIFLTPLFQRICGNIFLTITFSTDLWQRGKFVSSFIPHTYTIYYIALRRALP